MALLRGLLSTAIAVGITSSIACSQTVPPTRVRILVACPVGSPADILARSLAQRLSETSGRQFYVENVASGAGILGTAQDTKIDGNTIFFEAHDNVVRRDIEKWSPSMKAAGVPVH
jgi:tripartite-type tricarboxylate transporter receptor subunit TctC